MNLLDKSKTGIWILTLAIFHTVGVIGLNLTVSQDIFRQLSEINLFLSAFIVFLIHPKADKKFWQFFISVFAVGMAVEIIGVKTGIPFGDYHYSKVLKLHFINVPVIIGINWVVLTYATAILVQNFIEKKWLRILAGASVMATLDVILEHFAVKHGLWIWDNADYPGIANFAGWLGTALITHFIYQKTIAGTQNKVAVSYLMILTVFLAVDVLVSLLC